MRPRTTSTALAATLAVAMTLLAAAPAAADAVRRQQLDATANARPASGLSISIAGNNLKRTSDLRPETWWGYDSSWNRYSYVLNNPLKYTDPDGLQEVSEVVAPPTSMRKSSFGDFLRGVLSRMPGTNLQPNIMMIADDSRPQQITPEQVQQLAEIADAISVLTGPPAHEDGATGSPRKTRSLEDPGSLGGATYDDVVGTVPENWQASPTRTGAGIRYANPERRGEQLRIMQGNATDPNPVKQGPYVRISSRGVVSDPIPLAGNPTLDPTNGR